MDKLKRCIVSDVKTKSKDIQYVWGRGLDRC